MRETLTLKCILFTKKQALFEEKEEKNGFSFGFKRNHLNPFHNRKKPKFDHLII